MTGAPPANEHGHFVICGMGHVGRRIALLLRQLGFGVTAVYDRAPEEWLCEAHDAGVMCVQGDARNEQVLARAGVAHARGLIAATDRDMVNLSVALDGLYANPDIVTVVRLYDQELGHQISRGLNVRRVLSASALSAPVFVAAALGEESVAYFDYADSHYILKDTATGETSEAPACPLIELNAADGSRHQLSIESVPSGTCDEAWRRLCRPWRGLSSLLSRTSRGMRWLTVGLLALLVVGVEATHLSMGLDYLDAVYFMVTTVTTTGYGDVSLLHASPPMKLLGCFLMVSGAAMLALLFGIITDAVISQRFHGGFTGRRIRLSQHVIVSGSGHVMIRTVEELIAEGRQTVVVCPDTSDAAALGSLRVPFVEGDARMESVLRRAGVDTGAAFITVHDDDVLNLGAGLLAKKLQPAIRTVVRVFDGTLADKLQHQLEVDRVLSISAVSAPPFVAASLYADVLCATVWHDHLLFVRSTRDVNTPFPEGRGVSLCQEPGTGRLCRPDRQEPAEAGAGLQVCLVPLRPTPSGANES